MLMDTSYFVSLENSTHIKVAYGANYTKINNCRIYRGWFIVQRNVSNFKFDCSEKIIIEHL